MDRGGQTFDILARKKSESLFSKIRQWITHNIFSYNSDIFPTTQHASKFLFDWTFNFCETDIVLNTNKIL